MIMAAEGVSNAMVPFQARGSGGSGSGAGVISYVADYPPHDGRRQLVGTDQLIPPTIFEDHIDELVCAETSTSDGSCCSYTDLFNLRRVALRRWSHALLVLHQCRSLHPLADSLLIVAQCVDAIATMACGQAANAVDIRLLLDENNTASFHADLDFPASPPYSTVLRHGIDHPSSLSSTAVMNVSASNIPTAAPVPINVLPLNNCFCPSLQQLGDDQLAWIHDLAELPHHYFSQVISAAHRLGMRNKHIRIALLQYAEKSIFPYFGVLDDGALTPVKKKNSSEGAPVNKKDGANMQGEIIEKIVMMVSLLRKALTLCNEDEGGAGASFPMIRFLFGLLKCAHACGDCRMSKDCQRKLECMIEKRLESAKMGDFELPCSLIEAEGGGGSPYCCRNKLSCTDRNKMKARVYMSEEQIRSIRRRDKKEVESILAIISRFFCSRLWKTGRVLLLQGSAHARTQAVTPAHREPFRYFIRRAFYK